MNPRPDCIFCITTGRSGTDYLTRLFSHLPGCRSFHEAKPIGNGRAMRQFALGRPELMQQVARSKAENVTRIRQEYALYFESNHCFIKGFGWYLPEHIPAERIGVIILGRDKSKVAHSLLRIGCSPLLPGGRQWVMTPDRKQPLIAPPRTVVTYQGARLARFAVDRVDDFAHTMFGRTVLGPQWLADYELSCLEWYVEETRARAEAYRRRFPSITYYETRLEDLNTFAAVRRMLGHFGYTAPEALRRVVGIPTNQKKRLGQVRPGSRRNRTGARARGQRRRGGLESDR